MQLYNYRNVKYVKLCHFGHGLTMETCSFDKLLFSPYEPEYTVHVTDPAPNSSLLVSVGFLDPRGALVPLKLQAASHSSCSFDKNLGGFFTVSAQSVA